VVGRVDASVQVHGAILLGPGNHRYLLEINIGGPKNRYVSLKQLLIHRFDMMI
jgi:hypothetical protein